MLRVNALFTRLALVESNALLQACVFGVFSHERATTGCRRRLNIRTCNALSESVPSSASQSKRSFITEVEMKRIWWDKGSDTRKAISIWQPKPSPGFAVLGDWLVEGLEPPSSGVGLQEDEIGILRKPTTYLPCTYISGEGLEDVYIWFPVAPDGYIAVGCVATKTQQMPRVDHVCCIRRDYASRVVNFPNRPFWSMSGVQNKCSLWKVATQAHTFIAEPNLERHPDRVASCQEIRNRNSRGDSTTDTRDHTPADKRDSSAADKRDYFAADTPKHLAADTHGHSAAMTPDYSAPDTYKHLAADTHHHSAAETPDYYAAAERRRYLSDKHSSSADNVPSATTRNRWTVDGRGSSRREWLTMELVSGALPVVCTLLFSLYKLWVRRT